MFFIIKQECIPVGCVPPAAVAVCWGVCLPQCMLGYIYPPAWAWTLSPQVWVWRPPGCGPGDPPGLTPQPPPLGVGLVTPLARPPNLPPWPGSRHPPPHCEQND